MLISLLLALSAVMLHAATVMTNEEEGQTQLLMGLAYVDPFDLTGRISAILTDGSLLYLELKGNVSQIEQDPTGNTYPILGSLDLASSQLQYLLDLAKDMGIELDPRYQIYWGSASGLTSSELQEVQGAIVANGFPGLDSTYSKQTLASDRGHLCVRAETPESGLKTVCELGAGAAPPAWGQTVSDGMDRFINAKFGSFKRPQKYVFSGQELLVAHPPSTGAGLQSHALSSDLHGSPVQPQAAAATDPQHTSEYLIGSVGVSLILLESDGSVDPSTENWDAARADQVAAKVQEAFDFWANEEPDTHLSFALKTGPTGKPYQIVETGFEPVAHGVQDEFLWINAAMAKLGYSQGGFQAVRAYAHDLRRQLGTDWGYVIFMVDSQNDEDGSFAPGTFARTFFAYAYIGGPFLVMTYDNGSWGIGRMNLVAAHESGHIFYATDEYTIPGEMSGYFNALEVDDSGLLMDRNVLNLSSGTLEQIGWVDSDNDGILNVLDTTPETIINDTSENGVITIKGSARVGQLPNQNSRQTVEGFSPENLTLDTIARVEFSVDGAAFQPAVADDGAFNGEQENFTITLDLSGQHTVQVRAVNSVGNADPTPETATVGKGTPGPPTPPLPSPSSIEKALDLNGNGLLDDQEILSAIALWIAGQEVPGTGQTISDAKIKELIQMWIGGVPIPD